jgi:hypothetical protein
MDEKIFNRAISAYKVGNTEPLKEAISNKKEISGDEWYFLLGLMQEEIVFNMAMGSPYIPGTLPLFKEALEKADYNNDRLDSDKKFGVSVLAEDPKVFDEFMSVYVSKVLLPTSLSSSLLSIHPNKKEVFWESFFNNYLDSFSLEEFTDKQVHNIAANTNKIFDLDTSQHKNIGRAIEFDSEYPKGEVFEQILAYVIEFDRFAIPRTNIKRFGRNDDRLAMCKKFANILEKVELEIELENSKVQNANKVKLKI